MICERLFLTSLSQCIAYWIHFQNIYILRYLRYFDSVIWNSLPMEIRKDRLILSFVIKINQLFVHVQVEKVI